MRKLEHPTKAKEAERRQPMPVPAPLIEEAGMVKAQAVQKPALAAGLETKHVVKCAEPKKKGLTAQQYAAIFSFVMMVTAILSQATAIIGCTTNTLKAQRDAAPVVTTVESVDKGDPQS